MSNIDDIDSDSDTFQNDAITLSRAIAKRDLDAAKKALGDVQSALNALSETLEDYDADED